MAKGFWCLTVIQTIGKGHSLLNCYNIGEKTGAQHYAAGCTKHSAPIAELEETSLHESLRSIYSKGPWLCALPLYDNVMRECLFRN